MCVCVCGWKEVLSFWSGICICCHVSTSGVFCDSLLYVLSLVLRDISVLPVGCWRLYFSSWGTFCVVCYCWHQLGEKRYAYWWYHVNTAVKEKWPDLLQKLQSVLDLWIISAGHIYNINIKFQKRFKSFSWSNKNGVHEERFLRFCNCSKLPQVHFNTVIHQVVEKKCVYRAEQLPVS